MHPALKLALDSFAASAGQRAVAQVLEKAGKPAKLATILPIRRPAAHPLFFIGTKET